MSERCKFKLSEDSNCGSYQFNLHQQGIEQGTLCDVHYWQARVAELEGQLEGAGARIETMRGVCALRDEQFLRYREVLGELLDADYAANHAGLNGTTSMQAEATRRCRDAMKAAKALYTN